MLKSGIVDPTAENVAARAITAETNASVSVLSRRCRLVTGATSCIEPCLSPGRLPRATQYCHGVLVPLISVDPVVLSYRQWRRNEFVRVGKTSWRTDTHHLHDTPMTTSGPDTQRGRK